MKFWLNDPTVLFNKQYITELWPNKSMSQTQKLNAITRLIIILTILGYLLTHSQYVLVSGLVTLVVIVVLHSTKKPKRKVTFKEPFFTPKKDLTEEVYTLPTKENPLMNVLLPEIQDNPERKPAAPAFNPAIEKEINDETMDKRLFLDLGDNITFEQSMRQFYANPNTSIPNDQMAFAKFCYGDMPSCKEGDPFQCAKNNTKNRKVIY